MVGFCNCFSASSTKYDSTVTRTPEPHAAFQDVQLMHRDQAAQQAEANPQAQATGINTETDLKLSTDYATVAAKLASHQIAVSPEPCPAENSDGSGSAVDVVRQSEVDTSKGLSPEKAVPTEQLHAMHYKAADTITSIAAEASNDISNWGPSSGGLNSKSTSKTAHSSADKAPKSTPPSFKPAPWGSRAAATQVTPMRSISTKTGPQTPTSGPSPSVTRPTFASVARAQAVSAGKSASGVAGKWKL